MLIQNSEQYSLLCVLGYTLQLMRPLPMRAVCANTLSWAFFCGSVCSALVHTASNDCKAFYTEFLRPFQLTLCLVSACSVRDAGHVSLPARQLFTDPFSCTAYPALRACQNDAPTLMLASPTPAIVFLLQHSFVKKKTAKGAHALVFTWPVHTLQLPQPGTHNTTLLLHLQLYFCGK